MVRRTPQNALTLQPDATRLDKPPSEAGVESPKRSTFMSLLVQVAPRRATVPES